VGLRITQEKKYLFNNFTLINSFTSIDKPTHRTVPDNRQLFLKYDFAGPDARVQLLHGIIHNVFKGRSSDGKFENSLDPNITCLEEASAIGRNIVDSNP
jgi:hypothetical protein